MHLRSGRHIESIHDSSNTLPPMMNSVIDALVPYQYHIHCVKMANPTEELDDMIIVFYEMCSSMIDMSHSFPTLEERLQFAIVLFSTIIQSSFGQYIMQHHETLGTVIRTRTVDTIDLIKLNTPSSLPRAYLCAYTHLLDQIDLVLEASAPISLSVSEGIIFN